MNRRKALKIFGALFVVLAGRPVEAKQLAKSSEHLFDVSRWTQPVDYHFSEAGMGDIIIERKSGKKIVVPFSEICDALEG